MNTHNSISAILTSAGVNHTVVAASPTSGIKFPRAIGSFSFKETHQYGNDVMASYTGEHEGTQLTLMVKDIKDNKITMSLSTASNTVDATTVDLTTILQAQMESALEKVLSRPQSWVPH